MKNVLTKVWGTVKSVTHWATRPVRALVLAYSYVLTGQKVQTPYQWSEI